jgi:hypothetical protein
MLYYVFFFLSQGIEKEREAGKWKRRREKKKIPVHIIENLDSLFALIIILLYSLHFLCLFTQDTQVTEHTLLFICTYSTFRKHNAEDT